MAVPKKEPSIVELYPNIYEAKRVVSDEEFLQIVSTLQEAAGQTVVSKKIKNDTNNLLDFDIPEQKQFEPISEDEFSKVIASLQEEEASPDLPAQQEEDEDDIIALPMLLPDAPKATGIARLRLRAGKMRDLLFRFVVLAAAAMLITTLWISMLRVYGSSMEPNLYYNDILVVAKGSDFQQGDIVAFYFNNKVLLKRVVALPGDTVLIDDSGNVYVNNQMLNEPYLSQKSKGESDVVYPYVVPAEHVFVLGDQRSISTDSRSSEIGPIAEDLIIGRARFRIWPFSRLGFVQ